MQDGRDSPGWSQWRFDSAAGDMEIIITRGIPASGKSTWANAWVASSPDTRARINRDELRHMMFGKWHGVDEAAVSGVEQAAVRSALRAGKDVVVDATHLHPSSLPLWGRIAKSCGAEMSVRDFDVPDAIAIQRDASRDRSVGPEVIAAMRIKRNRLRL